MLHQPRRVLTPGASRKRKDKEGGPDALEPSARVEPQPALSNQIIAGYMAHEFLTRGTLLGQKWDPARAEAAPLVGSDFKRPNPIRPGPAKPKPQSYKQPPSYADVARLLKGDGAHVPGVVNPTQLGQWLQM